MTTSHRLLLCLLALFPAVAPLLGCDDYASSVAVVNRFDDASVYKAWWNTTLIADPVPPGQLSAAERTVPANEFAYALLAPGWSPASGGPPPALIAIQSRERLSVARGNMLGIAISDDTFAGNCAAGAPLDAESAAFIVERIFPGDFAGATYDPATCMTTRASAATGVDQ
jgi:hypothetical protein